jgi:hypothetical protein
VPIHPGLPITGIGSSSSTIGTSFDRAGMTRVYRRGSLEQALQVTRLRSPIIPCDAGSTPDRARRAAICADLAQIIDL